MYGNSTTERTMPSFNLPYFYSKKKRKTEKEDEKGGKKFRPDRKLMAAKRAWTMSRWIRHSAQAISVFFYLLSHVFFSQFFFSCSQSILLHGSPCPWFISEVETFHFDCSWSFPFGRQHLTLPGVNNRQKVVMVVTTALTGLTLGDSCLSFSFSPSQEDEHNQRIVKSLATNHKKNKDIPIKGVYCTIDRASGRKRARAINMKTKEIHWKVQRYRISITEQRLINDRLAQFLIKVSYNHHHWPAFPNVGFCFYFYFSVCCAHPSSS